MTSEEFGHLAACFPGVENAQPDGLLAYGGNLEPQTLLAAYSLGIFPWNEEGLPILWHCPNPRAILPLDSFCLPKRSARKIASSNFQITLDKNFPEVIRQCGSLRESTWITSEMCAAYIRLHDLGYAHSFEAWHEGRLVGGLYGVSLGRCFCGESMFHTRSEASRAALEGLVDFLRQENYCLLDIQQATPHMLKMGAISVPRPLYLRMLKLALAETGPMSSDAICPWPGWHKSIIYRRSTHSWV